MWHTWDHPAQAGGAQWAPSSAAPGLSVSLCSPVWWPHSAAVQMPRAWFPWELPVRGSQRALITSLKIWGFIVVLEEPGRMTVTVNIRGFCPDHFLSMLWTHPVAVLEFQLIGTCSVSTRSKVLWLRMRKSHKNALACWSKCSYIIHAREKGFFF